MATPVPAFSLLSAHPHPSDSRLHTQLPLWDWGISEMCSLSLSLNLPICQRSFHACGQLMVRARARVDGGRLEHRGWGAGRGVLPAFSPAAVTSSCQTVGRPLWTHCHHPRQTSARGPAWGCLGAGLCGNCHHNKQRLTGCPPKTTSPPASACRPLVQAGGHLRVHFSPSSTVGREPCMPLAHSTGWRPQRGVPHLSALPSSLPTHHSFMSHLLSRCRPLHVLFHLPGILCPATSHRI